MGDVEKLKEPLRSKIKARLAAEAVGRAGVSPVSGSTIGAVALCGLPVAAALPSPSAGLTRARRRIPGPKKQTATEMAYNRECLGGVGIFEGVGFGLAGGGRYTPDYYVPPLEVHEAKGWRRLGSQGRAHTAFREAAVRFPAFRFVWAERQKDRSWLVLFDSRPS